MKKEIIIIVIILLSNFIFGQEQKKKLQYINMSSFSQAKNTESYFNKYTKNNSRESNGGSLEINTIQGVKFFEVFSISVGISVDWNIDKTFLSTPLIIDLRIFSSKNNKPGFFTYIQTGQNIKWSDSFAGNGVTAKLGAGYIFTENNKASFYFDLFKKSKQIKTSEFQNNGYYTLTGFGISLGIIFK
ncbi:hypothetical protein [Flavobacterium sp. UGB4466]|uniref:hypothetical protein n=1 Tax=Flavobacterium sp. UGB4466 TaxID=2730889 RepID=UPI00192BECF8|nr:hypothetical protein [Flavobacterium sp. UGB4466]